MHTTTAPLYASALYSPDVESVLPQVVPTAAEERGQLVHAAFAEAAESRPGTPTPNFPQALLDAEASELAVVTNEVAKLKAGEEGDLGHEPATTHLRLRLLSGLISRALGTSALTGRLRYTPDEVFSWFVRAIEMGCATPRVQGADVKGLFRMERVPNALLRAEYERRVEAGEEGLASRLAEAMFAPKGNGDPETSGAMRALGVASSLGNARPDGGRYPDSLRLFMPYDQAVAAADVLGLSYHAIGV